MLQVQVEGMKRWEEEEEIIPLCIIPKNSFTERLKQASYFWQQQIQSQYLLHVISAL